ncbi:MAG: hypothetical protein ACI8S6_004284 [Myxococcota bacterium]|jgi:hypothetical protein
MRRVLFACALMMAPRSAGAADWLSLQGLEPDDPDKAAMRGFGFLQLSAEGYPGAAVDAAGDEVLSDFDGQVPVFNTIDGEAPWGVLLRRARVGARGSVPGVPGASAQLSVELGQNPQTISDGGWSPRLVDATMTLRSSEAVHLRLGRMKAPLSDEVLEGVHIEGDLIRFTRATGRLLMERDASSGVLTGPADGFRDLGVQAFGSHLSGKREVSWALMVGTSATDPAGLAVEPTVTGRVQLAGLLGAQPRRSPVREEAAVWGFASLGARDVGAELSARRLRAGGGAQLRWKGLRLRTEGIYADGVLATGISPPFAGGVWTMAPEGRAWGATGLASFRFGDRWEVGLTGSHLDSQPDAGEERRIFDDGVAHAQLHLSPRLWFDLNAGIRTGRAPEGSETAQAILGETAPYIGGMATASW